VKIILAEDAVQDTDYWHHLDRILGSVEDGWHEWQIDDPDMLEESEWLQKARPVLKKLFEKAAVHNAYSAAGSLHSKTLCLLRLLLISLPSLCTFL
jgi:hypothetical protein